jgi:hypothetical protein
MNGSAQELAAVRYAREFYEILLQDAKPEQIDGTEFTVWRGKLTEAFKQLEAANRYYTPIRAILTKTGTIIMVEAGSRNRDSIVALCHPLPPPAVLAPILRELDLTGVRPSATVWSEMERRVKALEAWRETAGGINLQEALRDFEERLIRLESRSNPVSSGKTETGV